MKITVKGTKTESVEIDVTLKEASDAFVVGLLKAFGLHRCDQYVKNDQIGHDERCGPWDEFIVDIEQPTREQVDVLKFVSQIEAWTAKAVERSRVK